MKALSLIAPLLAVAALAGCGSSSSTTTSSSSGASSSTASAPATTGSGGTSVVMKNLAFSPQTINAKVGQTIDFANQDTPPHNVTYVSGPKFTSSGTLNPGQSFKLMLTSADVGTIHYVCTIHPFMKGVIVVTK